MAEVGGVRTRNAVASRHDLEALFDDAVTGMAVIGLDGRFEAVNGALCRLLGYEQGELIGRRPSEVTHPDDRGRSHEVMDRLLTGRVSADQVHKRYLRRDGTSVSVFRTTTVLRDRMGLPSGLFTQVVDLTPLAEMQSAVRQSESRFRALVAHASDMMLLVDRAGEIAYASPASERVLGYTPTEAIGRSVFHFLRREDLHRARATFGERLARSGLSAPARYRVRHRDGGWRDVEVVSSSLFDDPAVGALVLNVRDVSEQVEYEQRLEAGQRRFQTLVGNSWDIISLHAADGRYLFCSPASVQLGYQPEEMIGVDPFSLIHPDDETAFATFQSVASGERRTATAEYRLRHRDGSWRWLESLLDNRLDDPAIDAVVVTTRDVTLRRRRAAQQEAVAALGSEALKGGPVEVLFQRVPPLLTEILEAAHCFLVRFEEDGRRTVVGTTDAALSARLSGSGPAHAVAAEAVLTRRPALWARHRQEGAGRLPAAAAPHLASAAAVPITPSDGPVGVLAVYSAAPEAFSADDVAFLEAVAHIVSAALSRQIVEEELRHQAVHDRLTGLPNRALLLDRLSRAMGRLGSRQPSLAVLFVDLDDFKLVNDSLGHSVGDAVVAAVAARLEANVRAADTVARFGGDEFVVISEDADETVARDLAERLRVALAEPMEIRGRTISVTASIGFVVTSDGACSLDALMSDADMAMYEAKRAGKDGVAMFAPELRRRATAEMEIVSGIRSGLAAGDFRLYYQPIVEAVGGDLIGVEALVRWEHPTAGLLAPGHFIHYAEHSGLIVPLGEWVLRTACRQSAEWRRAGRRGAVSINVSGVQLTGSDIVDSVRRALHDTGADPADISLEVTESAVMSDVERAEVALRQLRDIGVHVGMDDFGTGWSSLSQLARLPFDFVKIDRSFVRDLDRDERTAAMLQSMVALCDALDLSVVVEGVETAEQLGHLRRLGVRMVQGYLLGRPAPVAGV